MSETSHRALCAPHNSTVCIRPYTSYDIFQPWHSYPWYVTSSHSSRGCMHYCHRGMGWQHTVSLNFATIFDHPSSGASAPRAGPAKIIWRVMMSRKELKVKKKNREGEGGREGERKRNDLENIRRIWKQMYDIWSVRDPFVALMLLNTAWWRKYLARAVSFI